MKRRKKKEILRYGFKITKYNLSIFFVFKRKKKKVKESPNVFTTSGKHDRLFYFTFFSERGQQIYKCKKGHTRRAAIFKVGLGG